MQSRHIIPLLIVLLSPFFSLPQKAQDSGAVLRPDSAMPVPRIKMLDGGPLLRISSEPTHGPIVDRHYSMGCKFLYTNGMDELFMVYDLIGTAEYADGHKIEDRRTQEGLLSVGDMLSWMSIANDVNSFVKCLSTKETRQRPTEEDKHGLVSTIGKWEFTDRFYGEIMWERQGQENPYTALAEIMKTENINSDLFLGPDMWMVEYQSGNDLSILIDYFRNRLREEGSDPDNFSSLMCGWSPLCGMEIKGLSYKGSRYYFVKARLHYYLFGQLYAEGGFGKNCTLLVTSEPPAHPVGSATITRLGKAGKYMDSWEMETVMETSQYGVSYKMTRTDTYYLPYPTDDEMKEAARAAGYDVP